MRPTYGYEHARNNRRQNDRRILGADPRTGNPKLRLRAIAFVVVYA